MDGFLVLLVWEISPQNDTAVCNFFIFYVKLHLYFLRPATRQVVAADLPLCKHSGQFFKKMSTFLLFI
jgi:hypothetical protein